MVAHINVDTAGNEYRIYGALPGCSCGYCQDQRLRAAQHYAAPSTGTGLPDWAECGRLLDAMAQQLMKTEKILYGQAFSIACEKFPAVAALYSAGDTGTANTTPAEGNEARERERTYSAHDKALHDFNDTQKWRGGAGDLLDEKAKEIMQERGIKDYAIALNTAMTENPTLAERYNK